METAPEGAVMHYRMRRDDGGEWRFAIPQVLVAARRA
jgi:hypothetical protein